MRPSFFVLGAVLFVGGLLIVLFRQSIVNGLKKVFQKDGASTLLINPRPGNFLIPGIAIMFGGLVAAWYGLRS